MCQCRMQWGGGGGGGGGGRGRAARTPLYYCGPPTPPPCLPPAMIPSTGLHDIVLLEEGAGKRCSECETDGVWPRLKFSDVTHVT